MFGKKENDGFLDGLARTAANFVVAFAVIAVLWYLICAFFDAVRTRPLVVLMWACIICGWVYFALWYEKKEQEDYRVQQKATEDTRSGQEIWTENMKNYDAERGY